MLDLTRRKQKVFGLSNMQKWSFHWKTWWKDNNVLQPWHIVSYIDISRSSAAMFNINLLTPIDSKEKEFCVGVSGWVCLGERRIVICQWVAERSSICNSKREESVRLLYPGPTSWMESATGRILMSGIMGEQPRLKPLIDASREEPEQVLMCGSLCCTVIRLLQSQSAERRDARWDHTLSHRLGGFRPTRCSVKK